MRIVLWKSGDSRPLVRRLAARGVTVSLILGSRHPEIPSFTPYELFFGELERFRYTSEAPVPAAAEFLEEYSRCVARIGFNPLTRENNFRGGGIVHSDGVMDWAQLHLGVARAMLEQFEPDQFWICNHPQMGPDNAMVEAALQFDMPVLELTPLPIPGKFRYVRHGLRHESDTAGAPEFKRLDMQGFNPDLFYMKTVARDLGRGSLRRIRDAGKVAFRQGSVRALLAAVYESSVRRNGVIAPSLLELLDSNQRSAVPTRIQRRFSSRRADKRTQKKAIDAPPDTPFIYFPLHYEPEVLVSAVKGGFHNQANAIQSLHARLPDGWRILVKENPKQGYLHRDTAFHERLQAMPGVHYVSRNARSLAFIDTAEMVATINGTAGFEALRRGKPCVYFGSPWYEGLPGAIKYEPSMDFPLVPATSIDQGEVDRALTGKTINFADGLVHYWMAEILPKETCRSELLEITADSLVRLAESRV